MSLAKLSKPRKTPKMRKAKLASEMGKPNLRLNSAMTQKGQAKKPLQPLKSKWRRGIEEWEQQAELVGLDWLITVTRVYP